jgi:energy-coupling factor transporter ATP-binding protein EcfA2
MIEARGLVKRYGAAAAVNDLSFTIRPGLVTGFLGPNGAGKTTTMRLILGLDYPSAGTVAVNGKPYAQLPDPMHEVGALLDAGAVYGGRTACHHLLGLAQTNGIGRRRVDEVPACWARWRRRRVEARIGSLTPTIVPLSGAEPRYLRFRADPVGPRPRGLGGDSQPSAAFFLGAVGPHATPHAITCRLPGIDVMLEGRAERAVDVGTIKQLAAVYREGGWPAEA